ncbi:hypothetical protein ACSRUE_40445 [Sorangium sp. KYC3313]|jgi:hypothetical protein|uniref:hypothetical protein n=1 Tax=Sorangium sp. KYC3313 TaxID=3449740 RepID=UPI003F88E96C
MSNPEGLILVAPFAWGLYKCSVLARRPTANKKAVYALAAMLSVWLVLLTVAATSGGNMGDNQLLVAGTVLFTGGPIAASVLAILGLREIGRGMRTGAEGRQTAYSQGTWQAVGALVLAGAVLLPFAIYAGSHFSRGRAQSTTAGPSANWTRFASPQGDFEVQFPGVPEESAPPTASPGVAAPRVFVATHGRAMYGVTVIDDPAATVAGATAAFDAWEKGVVDRFPGRLTDRVSDASGSVATREIRGVSPTKVQAFRFRAVAVDRHMYVLAAIMPESSGDGQIADRFFNSFTLRSQSGAR